MVVVEVVVVGYVVFLQQGKLSFLLPFLTKDTVLNHSGNSVGDYSLDGENYILIMNVLASWKMKKARIWN